MSKRLNEILDKIEEFENDRKLNEPLQPNPHIADLKTYDFNDISSYGTSDKESELTAILKEGKYSDNTMVALMNVARRTTDFEKVKDLNGVTFAGLASERKIDNLAQEVNNFKDKSYNNKTFDSINPQASPLAQSTRPKVEKEEKLAKDSFFQDADTPGKTLNAKGEEIDPITQAIRDQVINKQLGLLQNWLSDHAKDEEEKKKIQNLNPQQFRDSLGKNNELVENAYKDPALIKQLNQVEVSGYKNVNENFKDRFRTVAWDGPQTDSSRSQDIKDKAGNVIASITEKTIKNPTVIKNENGHDIKVEGYRTIDFPIALKGEGPVHMQMAVKDENGRNIAEDKAVYFTAHYDKGGKLTEVSSPSPVKFAGKGDDAIGYIEREGKIYTLPVTKLQYKGMMEEIERNNGTNINLSQTVEAEQTLASDKIVQPKKEWVEGKISQEKRDLRKSGQAAEKPKEGQNIEKEKLEQKPGEKAIVSEEPDKKAIKEAEKPKEEQNIKKEWVEGKISQEKKDLRNGEQAAKKPNDISTIANVGAPTVGKLTPDDKLKYRQEADQMRAALEKSSVNRAAAKKDQSKAVSKSVENEPKTPSKARSSSFSGRGSGPHM